MQRWEIISLGFQHDFLFLFICFILIWKCTFSFEEPDFCEKNHKLTDEIFTDHFLSERVFRFIRIWKMVYQQFENAH